MVCPTCRVFQYQLGIIIIVFLKNTAIHWDTQTLYCTVYQIWDNFYGAIWFLHVININVMGTKPSWIHFHYSQVAIKSIWNHEDTLKPIHPLKQEKQTHENPNPQTSIKPMNIHSNIFKPIKVHEFHGFDQLPTSPVAARDRHSDEPGIAGRDPSRGQGVSHGGPNLDPCYPGFFPPGKKVVVQTVVP